MSISRKVELIFGTIILIMVGSFFYVSHYINTTVNDMKLFNRADRMLEDTLQVRRHEKNFILRGRLGYAELASTYLVELTHDIEHYRIYAYRKGDINVLNELAGQVKTFQKGFDDYVLAYKDAQVRPESQLLISSGRKILNLCQLLRDESSASIDVYLDNILRGKIIVLLLLSLVSLFAFWLTSRRITQPIKKLQRLCQEVGKEALLNTGQMKLVDSVVTEINSHDEIGELARVYREMLVRYNNSSLQLQQKIKEVEDLYHLKSEFTSMVTHELRTPLAPIKEGIDLVLDGSVGEITKQQAEFLLIAKRNVDRLARLINDVLDFSKLSAKKAQLKKEKVSINEIIFSLVTIFRLVVEKKGLFIITQLNATQGLIIELDSDRINQVLTNLIDNAVKFTDKGGIVIKTSLEDGNRYVKVCVEDTGVGIEKQDVQKLFHSFSQLGDRNSRRTGGTGLGLAISKEIIEQMGGKIWVESGIGKGSLFCFTVPLNTDKEGEKNGSRQDINS
jgi:signal transduction histidine kinase